MKHIPNAAWWLFGSLLAFHTGCSKRDEVAQVKKDDPVIQVATDDAEMTVAIAQARQTLPHFWQVFEKRSRGEDHFAIKVKITDKNGSEHFWVNQLERHGDKTTGTINNDPDFVASVKLGDRIEIPEADISDWLYMREGKMIGNRTMVPLFKSMPPEEVEHFKSIMADP